jgi:methylglyoxal synthase
MGERTRLTVAFITTPRFREKHGDEVTDFVATDLWHLCRMFNVCSTGGTYEEILKIIGSIKYGDPISKRIVDALPVQIDSEDDLQKQWQRPIERNLRGVEGGYHGMIRLTNDLIIGCIDAVIHLMDWDDVAAKPDTMVLRRQANVHDVPIACDLVTARAMVSGWKARKARNVPDLELCRAGGRYTPILVDKTREQLERVNAGDRVIALIAHDGMKLEMCRFAVQHAKEIVEYDAILATGTTGTWIKRFLQAAGRSKDEYNRVIPCLSGPLGGDVQIAWMVVQGICEKVIFFQDPMVSHAHATDILLFEQALLYREVKRALATNPETALALLEA